MIQIVAALILLQDTDGRVLAVARRGTTDQWGLPGGKIEKDERPQETAARELFEETGLKVDWRALIKIYTGIDDVGTDVVVYTTDTFTGELKQGDAGTAKWIEPVELLKGPFGKYNWHVLEALNDSDHHFICTICAKKDCDTCEFAPYVLKKTVTNDKTNIVTCAK